jgi:peptidyl-prolyl cis-trans isomerase C
MPELLNVLPTLKDGEVSDVIHTSSGYNLIMVLERRDGKQKPFRDIRDRVRQMMVNEKLPAYLGKLQRQFPVTWTVMADRPPVAKP